jgi:hypothetical protein
MALVVIREDGTGRPDANCYADSADCDIYHEGHLYADAWNSAAPDAKDKAVVMAARLIDAEFRFNGWRAVEGQALQWPRQRCPDPDSRAGTWVVGFGCGGNYIATNVVPKGVTDANCELARLLLVSDRTDYSLGQGLHSSTVASSTRATDGSGGSDSTATVYDKADKPGILSPTVVAMLSKFGSASGAGAVRLVRS